MFEHVVKFLHQKDKSILSGLAYSGSSTDLANYVSSTEEGLRSALKIDDHIFMERNTSTALKMSILRRLFALYDADPMDLVFYLKDTESEKVAEASRYEIRKRYWTYALPLIQKQHAHRGTFTNCSPKAASCLIFLPPLRDSNGTQKSADIAIAFPQRCRGLTLSPRCRRRRWA